jgi:3-hydroxyisobutyrate dehydrogenase-like beta-hydroxyacid dehydrogenase
MVGGTAAAYERAQPILRTIGDNIRHIGDAGAGTAIKLINQSVYVAYMTAFGEGLALGESIGIPLETLLDVLGSSAAGHPMISTKYPEIRSDGKSGPPGFAVDRGILFLNLAREAFRDSPYRKPLIDAAFASLRDAEKKGLARDDIIVARKRYLGKGRAK